MKKTVLFSNFSGFVFVSIVGTLLHFVFDWSHQNIIVGMFSAVNESIWEHVKLLFFPLVLFFIIQYKFARNPQNAHCANFYAVLAGTTAIPALYYLYTGALGVNIDWFNILIFYISSAISFFARYKTIKNKGNCYLSPAITNTIIAIITLLFIIFTFMPMHIPLFIDPLDQTYGYFKST